MSLLTARNLCILFGVVFAAVGVLGFVPNPLVSENGVFAVNMAHNLTHLVSAALLLGAVFLMPGKESMALAIIAIIYAVVAILGFVMTGDMLLGMIHVNEADKYLHLLLAIVLGGAALMVNKK